MWQNKTSPGVWQQIVGKLKSKAAVTEFLSDVWITRCCAASCNTFVSVSLGQKHREREREKMCESEKSVFTLVYNQWQSLWNHFSRPRPHYLHHIYSTQIWTSVILSSHPSLTLTLSSHPSSMEQWYPSYYNLCRAVEAGVGRLNVRAALRWRAFGWRVKRSQLIGTFGESRSVRSTPKNTLMVQGQWTWSYSLYHPL